MRLSRIKTDLTLEKEKEGNLIDKSHIPKTFHPKTTSKEIIDLIVKTRKETGFSKRRLKWRLALRDNFLITESTIGKILKVQKLSRAKKRVRREYHRIKINGTEFYHLNKSRWILKKLLTKEPYRKRFTIIF